MPRSVHRLDPSSLRFGIIALELAVLPFVLSAATTALFFALPESRLYLVLRLTWPGVYLTNLFLCLLCKSNKRFALFSASTFRNADSFGNESLERAERSTWSFKYNSLFKPKLFLASNDVESSKGDFLTRRGRDIAPQALSVPNGTVDTSMRQSFQDDVSIYSSTALMGGHQGFFEPVTGQAYTTPVYDHHPYPEVTFVYSPCELLLMLGFRA